MIAKYVISLILLVLTIESESTRLTSVVQTNKGPVQGEILKTVIRSIEYSAFKGIPYAEPPLGRLRFKPPVPKKPWINVRRVTLEGANCVQKDFVYQSNYTGSEDCLYLNVYTPKLDLNLTIDKLLPVMIWIYGGSFKAGYSNSSLYGPDLIIEENVVLVTFNYRLGPLGFLNLDHKDALGNAALKDQNLVMHWVRENIDKFGGNPNSVTLFGQSAGGVSVDLHSLSDMSQGLFHRSISMSASPLCPWGFQSRESAIKKAFALGEKLGISTSNKNELLERLYEVSALSIMEKTEEMGKSDPPFKPSVENPELAKDQAKFISECPYWKYASGNFSKLPHLTGFTSHETLLFAGSLESILDLVNFTTRVVKMFPAASPMKLPITERIVSTIADGVTDLSNSIVMELIDETTDILFVAGINAKRKWINSHSEYPVYFYRFSYESVNPLHKQLFDIQLNGTAHGDDFGYPFHMTVADLPLDSNNPTYVTRRRMTHLWTNFAKYSDPTPRHVDTDNLLQDIKWIDSDSNDTYLEFDANLTIRRDPTTVRTGIVEKANIAILPVQTGCVGDLIKKLAKLNPFSSDSDYSIGQMLTNKTKSIGSKIVGILGRR